MNPWPDRPQAVAENPEIQEIDERHDLSQHIFFRRESAGWSQQELADRSGLTQAQVARLEAGHSNPTLRTLTRVANAFGCRVAEVMAPGIDDFILGRVSDASSWWEHGQQALFELAMCVDEPDYEEDRKEARYAVEAFLRSGPVQARPRERLGEEEQASREDAQLQAA